MIEHSVRWSNANWKFLRTSIDLLAYITPVLCQQISFPLTIMKLYWMLRLCVFIDFHCVKCKNGLWIELWIDDGMQFDYWGMEMVKWKLEYYLNSIYIEFLGVKYYTLQRKIIESVRVVINWNATYAKKWMDNFYDEALLIHQDFYLMDDWWYDEIRLKESFGFVKNLKDGREYFGNVKVGERKCLVQIWRKDRKTFLSSSLLFIKLQPLKCRWIVRVCLVMYNLCKFKKS